MPKPAACVITFSPIDIDMRVLREVRCLARDFDVTVVSLGSKHPDLSAIGKVTFIEVPQPPASTIFGKLSTALKLMLFSRFSSATYDRLYWSKEYRRAAFEHVRRAKPALIVSNDWDTLPIAVRAGRECGAKIIWDAHEFAPLEFESSSLWRLTYGPFIRYILNRNLSSIHAALTVCAPIAERFKEEFGIEPTVLYSTPNPVPIPAMSHDPVQRIRLVHQGLAMPERGLELMIDTVALCDQRFSLHFLLIGNQQYIEKLKGYAAVRAPGRVEFPSPVAPAEIVPNIARYDMGFALIKPTSYNYLVCMPNKFFEALNAGLPVCIGPSPAMAELIRQYGCGCVAKSFEPAEIATALNGLTAEDYHRMQRAAVTAAKELNADVELQKLSRLANKLVPTEPAAQATSAK